MSSVSLKLFIGHKKYFIYSVISLKLKKKKRSKSKNEDKKIC